MGPRVPHICSTHTRGPAARVGSGRDLLRVRERGHCHTSLACVPGGRVLSTGRPARPRRPQPFAAGRRVEGSQRLQPARQGQGQAAATLARGALSGRRNAVRAPGSGPGLSRPSVSQGQVLPRAWERCPSSSLGASSLCSAGFASPGTSAHREARTRRCRVSDGGAACAGPGRRSPSLPAVSGWPGSARPSGSSWAAGPWEDEMDDASETPAVPDAKKALDKHSSYRKIVIMLKLGNGDVHTDRDPHHMHHGSQAPG